MSVNPLARRVVRSLTPRVLSLVSVPARFARIDPKLAAQAAATTAGAVAQGDRNMDPMVSLRLDLNVLKDAPPIEEKPDAEYPDWLWTIHEPLPTIFEMEKAGPETLPDDIKRRYFKLTRRRDIKAANSARAKN